MKSIMQNDHYCFVCHRVDRLEDHHIFYGTGNRQISEENGFKVWLCNHHHRMVHLDPDSGLSDKLKQECQRRYEECHKREDFMALIGKNHL